MFLSTGNFIRWNKKHPGHSCMMCFFLVLFLLLPGISQAQRILDFDKLALDDGFTSGKANAIIQDSKGFMWIGTWNGLNRYDGYEVEIFRPGYHDTTSISNREVSSLLEDHKGNIWVGTTSGLNKYDPVKQKWTTYPFQHRIISLHEDRKHIIWIGTWNGGLHRLDVSTGEISHFLENEIISDIYEDSRNILWVATYYGLLDFDRSTSGFTRYLPNIEHPERSVSHSIITQIEESKDGILWLGTWGGGLNRVEVHPNRDSLKFTTFTNNNGKNSLPSNVIYRLHYDQFDNLWIGTWSEGMSLLEHSEQKKGSEEIHFLNYKSDLRNPYGLSGNNISAIYVDRAGILWVGSTKLDRTNILNTGVIRYKTTIYSGDNYVESPVRAFSNNNGVLWVGTTNNLKLYNSNHGDYSLLRDYPKPQYTSGSSFYYTSSIMSILQGDDGLWIGTEDAGLVFYPGVNKGNNQLNRFIYFNTNTNPSIPGNKVGELVKSRSHPGVIWIGTTQNGFARLEKKEGKYEIKSYRAGYDEIHLSNNNVRALIEDVNGYVWIGTQNGLNCFNPSDQTFIKYFYELGDTTSINDNVINVIYEDSEGDIWIGTNAGLNRLVKTEAENNAYKISFKGYPNIENISGEIVTNILEDNNGNIWAGVYKGMVRISKSDMTVTKEYFSKDYQHLIIERNSAIKGESGNFLFGGGGGFLSFNPDSLLRDVVAPQICVTDLQVFNNSLNEGNPELKDKSKFRAVPYLDSLTLSHRAKILTFAFSAMDYKDPKRNKYSYILEGLEDNWNDVGTRNTATYTNLKPGDYIFKVKAFNSVGIESEYPAEFHFTIATPWWQSVVAYIFYILILAGLLYFFNQYSIIGVREKGRIMIEHMQYEKEHEVNEMKSLFFTNITHEFRTPLTLIMGPVEELLKSVEISGYARRQAELIQKNAQRLLRLVNQLMEFRKVEKGKMEIKLKKVDVVILLNELYDSFKSMADSRNIEFTLIIENNEIEANVDYEKLEKALFNLLSNAFKYSEDSSKITVHAEVVADEFNERMLIVEVEDTGIGIPEDFHDKVFERFFQANQKTTQSTGGIGLYLSKTFIEQHGGNIELESEVGQGSCFRVILPIDRMPEELATEEENIELIETTPEEQEETQLIRVSNDAGNNEKPKVLIVEDDSELNEFIVTGLASEFEVYGAINGVQGLEIARKNSPDIIITDIMMPEMDGIQLGRVLRKDLSTSHIPLIFLTAKTMKEDEIKGLEIGAVDYIYKPFNLISLKLKVQNILDNRKRIHNHIRANQIMEPERIELSSLDEKFLKDAVQSVNDNLDDSTFDVEKFSNTIGMSPNQAYRKIKALTGQTAKEFIRNQRLKTAADMLLQKRRSISEIIYMVGFSSPSYFTRCFKEYFGCTPKEYIDKNTEQV